MGPVGAPLRAPPATLELDDPDSSDSDDPRTSYKTAPRAHSGRSDRRGHEVPSYNSCRDRHCPSCQGHRAREWLEARESELLPVPYFHVVFTMPGELSEFALVNKRVIYQMLFASAAETLKEVARRRLDAEIGFLAMLHTWSQTML